MDNVFEKAKWGFRNWTIYWERNACLISPSLLLCEEFVLSSYMPHVLSSITTCGAGIAYLPIRSTWFDLLVWSLATCSLYSSFICCCGLFFELFGHVFGHLLYFFWWYPVTFPLKKDVSCIILQNWEALIIIIKKQHVQT